MRTRFIAGIIFVVLGLFIAIGPQVIFPVCNNGSSHMSASEHTSESHNSSAETQNETQMNKSPMKCHWTAQAELGVGVVIALLGLAFILIQNQLVRIGINIGIFLNGILALLLPTALIGVCGSVRMNCHQLTLPVLITLSSLTVLASVITTIILYLSHQKENSHVKTTQPQTPGDE